MPTGSFNDATIFPYSFPKSYYPHIFLNSGQSEMQSCPGLQRFSFYRRLPSSIYPFFPYLSFHPSNAECYHCPYVSVSHIIYNGRLYICRMSRQLIHKINYIFNSIISSQHSIQQFLQNIIIFRFIDRVEFSTNNKIIRR